MKITLAGIVFGILFSSAQAENMYVRLTTNKGPIVLELYDERAPKSVANFLQYVNDGFYDGTIFHRVVPEFVIQGGGFDTEMQQKETRGNVENEADNMLPNLRGSVAMARTMEPHSASSQFFINLRDNVALNHTGKVSSRAWGYAVFARVVKGMDVVDAIAEVPTGSSGMHQNVPSEPVVIEKAEVVDSSEETEA